MLQNNVKMVIWDLDDTFWKGTLAEIDAIEAIPDNIAIVRRLTERGIVSSICSRNDHDVAKAKLSELGVWDLFVFPRIEFAPKGQAIAEIIEDANLRPDNVLFIDDNPMNLEEARHFSPTLMTALPLDLLPTLLDDPRAAGKPDPAHEKLQQYKNIERKAVDRATSTTSNEAFLRGCDIGIEIDFDFEQHLDRVIELANKTNQLNFTKLRVETEQEKERFRRLCGAYGVSAGVVRVWDRYGDYGVVGYFVMTNLPHVQKLHHFVFSCRTMNMGVEQYVYERIGRPPVTIVPPVSNPIDVFERVDWIKEGGQTDQSKASLRNAGKLVLLGGCQLLQLSAMCSNDREDFVNEARAGASVRYDEIGFILGDPDTIAADGPLNALGLWNAADKRRFDAALADAQIVLIAPLAIAAWNYFRTNVGNLCRIDQQLLESQIRLRSGWFLENFEFTRHTLEQRLELLTRSLAYIVEATPASCRRMALGAVTGTVAPAADPAGHAASARRAGARLPDAQISWRTATNQTIRDFCLGDGRFEYVDVEALVPPSEQFDEDHFTRRGYIALADAINARLNQPLQAPANIADEPSGRMTWLRWGTQRRHGG
jgi:FkbH-like protein